MYYKTEAYIGSEYAGKHLYDAGLTPVYVSDNPVLNAQHVLFEAAKAFSWGLPYHAALASVTTAPADDLGMGERLGKIKPGFDADIAVWDSDPLSVGATPVQVWIDGTAQFEDPVILPKSDSGVTVPNASPVAEEPKVVADALFSGVSKVLLDDEQSYESDGSPMNVAISKGKIICVGTCRSEFQTATAAGIEVVALKNGYLHYALVGVGGTLGLNEIDAEISTDNGDNPEKFSRAVDGLMLDSKKLQAGFKAGVTRAISAPKFIGGATHHGTSVGFVTDAKTSIDEGAVFEEDLAVHYSYDLSVRNKDSYTAAFGALRKKLLDAINSEDQPAAFTEAAYLQQVVTGNKTLALTINSADGIASVLRIKSEIDAINNADALKLAIIGGAESHLVAEQLATANVGVILSPLQSIGDTWDARRALSGAPLTNGTTIDYLVDAGVKVGIGLREDWEVRDLGFAAGTAYINGGGKLSEKEAIALVSTNPFEILGAEVPSALESGHFVVSEGSPLEIGSRVKAVGSGKEKITLYA